jgi:hypothetical protein
MLGNGHKLRFWMDAWLDGTTIQQFAPDLVTAVPKHQLKRRTVADALNNGSWIQDVQGPRTALVIVQYLDVRQRVEEVTLYP